MLSTQKSVIILGVVILLIFFGYSFFIKGDTTVPKVSQTSTSSGNDILVLVDTLKKISIDTSLFESELFRGLKDFSVGLYPEQQGRTNPFASIGAENNNSNQNSNQTPPPPKKTGQ